MFDFGALPPEINSGRMYAGPGAESMMVAATAWDGLAAELGTAASGYSSVITELWPLAAVANSAASASQAVAATIIDSAPGPAYIRPELISGGNAPKSNTVSLLSRP